MADGPEIRPAHLTISVSDLDRSIAFYRDALGFELRYRLDQHFETTPVTPGCDIRYGEAFLTLGSMLIALCAYENPPVLPAIEHHYNRLGFTQFAFDVDDIDAVAARIEASGGKMLDTVVNEQHGAIMRTFGDPDGTRLELVQRTA